MNEAIVYASEGPRAKVSFYHICHEARNIYCLTVSNRKNNLRYLVSRHSSVSIRRRAVLAEAGPGGGGAPSRTRRADTLSIVTAAHFSSTTQGRSRCIDLIKLLGLIHLTICYISPTFHCPTDSPRQKATHDTQTCAFIRLTLTKAFVVRINTRSRGEASPCTAGGGPAPLSTRAFYDYLN
ncbi:hypothetical protein EVAR_6466_1 [Eumeta japonica]|uniref:Uncharacterized protein n=1 Tax=Eumeta variegata TaxID=151549 RepID=A0A4C1ST45_EUMVA|nr:hypothetical protein EVAR_6466_1 [Eumeta japonica]